MEAKGQEGLRTECQHPHQASCFIFFGEISPNLLLLCMSLRGWTCGQAEAPRFLGHSCVPQRLTQCLADSGRPKKCILSK